MAIATGAPRCLRHSYRVRSAATRTLLNPDGGVGAEPPLLRVGGWVPSPYIDSGASMPISDSVRASATCVASRSSRRAFVTASASPSTRHCV